ncbi:MAG: EAL domain-containing protein [Synergistaceae bacterium]|nr:EAL domain-containing protein [Synergistaceae bacterium]
MAYTDTGVEVFDEDYSAGLSERYHALELRYQQLAKMLRVSENDELTGLLGKQAFYRHVREIINENPDIQYTIVRFDINRFKVFNDVNGTAAGDRLLCDIADMIKRSGKAAILSARLESDHFVLLTRDNPKAAERSEKRLLQWLTSYSPDFRLTFTIGIYQITDRSVEVSFMCDRALLAMHSVKSGFDTRMAYYDTALRDTLLDEQMLIEAMKPALEKGEFILHFQPQINYENGRLVGAEALVRWQHPTRGLLTPDKFIPLFERNGLITRLDEYVWDRCCRYIKNWRDAMPKTRDLETSVSVNVSRLDIYDEKLSETLGALMEKYGLPHSALRLEITESAYMENQGQLIETVDALHKAGFTVEMDDFGSGYSSLNTLKDVYVDVLKLDMKFLAECRDSARGGNILSSVIRMAHWLKLPLIAEGVETKDQADYLKSLGCLYMQGYYFARPRPAEDFEKILAQSSIAKTDKYVGTNIDGMAAFWDPSAQIALLFNSYLGGAAIMEYKEGVLEATRVNDNFYKVLGTTREEYAPMQMNVLNSFDEANRVYAVNEIETAIATGDERYYELRNITGVGGVTREWTGVRLRLLVKNNDSSIFYVCIEDITDRKLIEQEREVESERNSLLMKTTGLTFFSYDYDDDTMTYQMYIPYRGVVKRVVPECGKKCADNARLDPRCAKTLAEVIGKGRLSHIDGSVDFRADLHDMGMRWYRMRYSSVEDAGGRVYRIVGQATDIQEIRDNEALSEAIQRRLDIEAPVHSFNSDIVSRISILFYTTPDIEGAIKTTLSLLGEYYDLSRVYICEDVDGHTASSNTFEWCAEGVRSQKEFLKYVRYDDLGGWEKCTKLFDENGTFYCPDVKALPNDGVKAVFEAQDISAFLQCAIMDSGMFSGVIGFDEYREGRGWADEQVGTLQFISRIISTFLLNLRKAEKAMFSDDFRASLDDNAAYVYIVDPNTHEIIYNNKAIVKKSGDFVGQKCHKVFINIDEPCGKCPIPNMSDPDKPHIAEIVRPDGMAVLTHVSPIHWEGRGVALVSCIDITDSKKAEAALKTEKDPPSDLGRQ